MSKQTGERQVEFVQLREDEYESFVSSHTLGSLAQSVATAKRRQLAGWQTYLVGVRDKKGAIVAAAMLTSRGSVRRLTEFEAAEGPIMDYDDEALVTFFFGELRRFSRRQNAVRLRISPPLARNHRDKESNVITDGYDGGKYTALLKKLGFVQVDADEAGGTGELARWYASKDLRPYETADDLLKSFDLQARWSIKKARELGVAVKSLGIEDIEDFYPVLERRVDKTAAVRSKKYYHDLVKAYGENVQFCAAQLDLARYESIVTQKLVDATAIITDINPRTRSKVKKQQLIAAKRVASLSTTKLAAIHNLQKDGDIVTIAVAIFVRYGDKLVYMGGRSNEYYRSFGAPYALQWYGQLFALENNLTTYDFSVTKGIFSGHPEHHGSFRFKKGFGAVVQERIGHFEIYPYAQVSNKLVLGKNARISHRSRSRMLASDDRDSRRQTFSPLASA